MTPDIINGLFECFGGVFILQNIRKILKDKMVRGADWRVMTFFTVWGYWNLYYYPFLDQWWSFAGGVAIVITNTIYSSLMIYYIARENKGFSGRSGAL